MEIKMLITGGEGFVGKHLSANLIGKGFDVDMFDLPNNVCDFDALSNAATDCKVIYHLAGMLGTHELNDWKSSCQAVETNITGTLNVLEVAKQKNIKVIFISKPNVWSNTYTITKIAAENFCEMYYREFDLDVSMFRAFNIFGEGQRLEPYRKAVPHFILEALNDEPITVFGNGKQTVDLIYVGDVAEVLARAGTNDALAGKNIDLGSGIETSVDRLATRIIELTKSKSRLNHIPMRSGELPETSLKANTEAMEILLGIKVSHWETNIEQTINYYKNA